jgi:membrane protease YdiL (CAAX protease family)
MKNRTLWEAIALAVGLVAYSNGLALWSQRRGGYPESLFRRLNPVLVALMLAYAVKRPGGLAAVGLRGEGLGVSLLVGSGLGLVLSLPALAFFYQPVLLDTPLEYGPVARMSRRELLQDVFLRMPLGIAVLEELAHRGLLQAALREQFGTKTAIVGSAIVFAGWHFTVTATSAAQTNLAESVRLPSFLRPYIKPLAVAGGMLSTCIAGLLFGIARERTGNLAGPMMAHWLVDGIMIVALWRTRKT